jgi:hypothetical protein
VTEEDFYNLMTHKVYWDQRWNDIFGEIR